MKKILVPLAEGCEEIEAVTVVDVLRRAEFEVVTAGLRAGALVASRGVTLVPDVEMTAIQPLDFDAIVVPGGYGGVMNLMKDERVLGAIRALDQAGRWVCAVCAGPLVLQAAGILEGRRVTCYPSAAGQLTATPRVNERVVVDGRLITSQGPGTSMAFALEIVRQVGSASLAQRVASELLA
ncbi:MAG: DJ-1/PfpI family protein [Kiritimatiellae bacterium]|nr:DJ-1/PfpI family protein [Kiritimatiellia bacterium]